MRTLPAAMILALASGIAFPQAAAAQDMAGEVQALRDREAIHRLLLAYGRTLDEGDFEGFGALFTADGEYAGSRGPQAIADGMRAVFAANPMDLPGPAFHVFFNEAIDLAGDRARSTSMSFYVVPDDRGGFRIAMMAAYEDDLARVGDEWKFARRTVRALSPDPSR